MRSTLVKPQTTPDSDSGDATEIIVDTIDRDDNVYAVYYVCVTFIHIIIHSIDIIITVYSIDNDFSSVARVPVSTQRALAV